MDNHGDASPVRSTAHHGVKRSVRSAAHPGVSSSAASEKRCRDDMTKEERDLKRARHAEKKAKLAQATKSLDIPETVVENSTVNSSWHWGYH